MEGEQQNSTFARDVHLIWSHVLSLVYLIGYFAFLFLVFASGKVNLDNSTVSALANSAIVGLSAALMLIVRSYYKAGILTSEIDKGSGS